MTIREFRQFLNTTYGLKPWPTQLEVDADTYANVCVALFNWHKEQFGLMYIATVDLGHNGGIMYHNVELILKKPS